MRLWPVPPGLEFWKCDTSGRARKMGELVAGDIHLAIQVAREFRGSIPMPGGQS